MQSTRYVFSAEKGTHLHLIYELFIRHFSCASHCTAVSFHVNKSRCTRLIHVETWVRVIFPSKRLNRLVVLLKV